MATSDSPPVKKQKQRSSKEPGICIIHFKGTDGSFTFISSLKEPHERFETIKTISNLRQQQPIGSTSRMNDVCKSIPETLNEEVHGYHRACYNKFIKNKDRLVQLDAGESSDGSGKSSRRSSSDKILFAKDCIFCNKEGRKWHRKKGKGSVSEKTTVFDMGGGKTVQEQAERKHDEKLLIRIRGKCLFSVEAHYHPSCRRQYARMTGLGRSQDDQQRRRQIEMEQAHSHSFDKLCNLITERVLQQQEIMKLSDALRYYVGFMSATKYPCPDYRAEKVKQKLQNHDIGSKI